MTQDKKTLRFLAIALGLTGAYLLISKLSKAKGKANEINDDWVKYKVKTMGSPLNVREIPSVTSKIVDSLQNGSEIFGRRSVANGWIQVSKDGLSSIGFVSNAYLIVSDTSKAINTQGTSLEEIKIVIPLNYIVRTSGDALNVRKEPNVASPIVKKYMNGSIIKARKSSVQGWHEVLEQDLGSIGYVSSDFIVKK